MSRILLVEDDTMIASGILYALETEGYETNHATGIKDARSLIEHYNFDLAIIDMQLPDGTGFDVSEIFKNNATSVIFLTVVDDENTIVRAFDEGAQDYIVKPFRIRELLARVRRILSANIKNGEKDNMIYMGHAAIHTDEAKHLPGQMSGGQQQRVSIGRALINEPAFILADEPTGNLDSKTSREILDILKFTNQKYKQTILLVTHDEKIALQANRIITIGDGKIIKDEVMK